MSRHKAFWDKEYKTGEHFALSNNPSEDLEKFCRFVEREEGKKQLNVTALAVDFGCGNGRNLIYLGETFGTRGIGYDISNEAIKQAKLASKELQIIYEARSIAGTFPNIKDASVNIILDMMSSHFLNKEEREIFRDECVRVLRPGGWMFFKSFLKDEDRHAARLLREHAGSEENTYVHPKMGVEEHVWSLDELGSFWSEAFDVVKVDRSHKHILHGRAFKRRTVSVYLQKMA